MYAFVADQRKPEKVMAVANPNLHDPKGIKFSSLVSPDPEDSELQFLAQMGVTHTYTWIQKEQANVKYLTNLRKKLNSYGITLWNVGMLRVGKSKDIILGTDNRDAMI